MKCTTTCVLLLFSPATLLAASLTLDFENSTYSRTISYAESVPGSGTYDIAPTSGEFRWAGVAENIDLRVTVVAGVYEGKHALNRPSGTLPNGVSDKLDPTTGIGVGRDPELSYDENNPAPASVQGEFGVINMKGNSATTFKFELVDSVTGDAVIRDWKLALFDLDAGTEIVEDNETIGFIGTESVRVVDPSSVASYSLSGNSEVLVDDLVFTATSHGRGPDNPISNIDLRPKQNVIDIYNNTISEANDPLTYEEDIAANRAVLIELLDTSELTLELDISSPEGQVAGGYRNFLFAGEVNFDGYNPIVTAVPEPSSLSLWGMASIGFLLRRRRG